jgi:DNA ligase (NAD+)
VGAHVAELLAGHFSGPKALMDASYEDVRDIAGVGPTIAESVVNFFRQAPNRRLIQRLLDAGVNPAAATKAPARDGPLAGAQVVFTGTLSRWPRSQAESLVREAGGVVSDSVTKKTTYVVTGETPGSKLDKARRLGIKVLTEDEFVRLVKA